MMQAKSIIALLLLLLCLTGCIYDDYADEPSDRPDEGAEMTYLRLYISTASAGRTRATGGENGDYKEVGINHENDINNLTIFIYNDPDGSGLDGNPDTPVRYARYFSQKELDSIMTGNLCTVPIPIKEFTLLEGDRVFVAVNTEDYAGVDKLGTLREIVVRQSFTPSTHIADYDSFAMSNAYNAGQIQTDNDHDGTEGRPYYAHIDLERLAARVDFLLPGEDSMSDYAGCITYPILDAQTNQVTGSHIYITHILPINIMRGGSYLVKRVTANAPVGMDDMATASLLYCGDETTDGNMTPTNYVVEPRTLIKDGNTDVSVLNTWYGDSRASLVRNNPAAFTSAFSVESLSESNGGSPLDIQIGGSWNKGFIVTYADENTCHRSLHSAEYISGLAFRTIYSPTTVYADATLTNLAPAADYVPNENMTGKTFWAYYPSSAEANENFHIFFSTKEAAEEYLAAHPEDRAEITEYADGLVYYNMWLRHATPPADSYTCAMEYAVVRNNVYRVSVSFTAPGEVTPEINDIQPGGIECRIYVRKWNEIQHTEIVL